MGLRAWIRSMFRRGCIVPPAFALPGLRDCPPAMLARLREIDPTAVALEIGDGFWQVGFLRWNAEACRLAQQAITRELAGQVGLQRHRRIALLQLTICQGYRPMAMYECPEIDDGVVRDVALADWNYRNRQREAFAENFYESSDEPAIRRRQQVLVDASHTFMPDVWRHHVVGRPRSFTRRAVPRLTRTG
jgi:hypothetical protein